MKQLFYAFLLICTASAYAQQTGYAIGITLKPYRNQYVYLGYYYGKIKALADSVRLNNNSSGIFRGRERLNGGIYFVVSPNKEILFELLLDKQQHFSVSADSAKLPGGIYFTGSAENALFQSYSAFTAANGKAISSNTRALAAAKSHEDSARIAGELRRQGLHLQRYRDSLAAKHPGTMLAALFQALKEPIVPPAAKHPHGVYDSVYAYRYFKNHFWDGVSFSDERLVRTPIFELKLDKYYKDLVVPAADSIITEVDYMLIQARPNKEMFKYLLTYFVQQYINPHYMGQDAVFVHLFEKYINNHPEVDWFTEKYQKFMSDRAYSLMANLIGSPAQNMELVDTLNQPRPLYSIAAPYTIICFWDPTCSHCKEIVPKVDSMYRHKWKQEGVVIYGVMVDGGRENWLDYIRENNLREWIHVYETKEMRDAGYAAGKPNYRQLYDVYQTPVLYLLDKDKRIIAKKLACEQLDQVLTLKLQQAAKQ